MYTPIDASAKSGEWGIGGGVFGFSWNPVTRSCSSTATMPKRDASATGTSMAASVTAAPRLLVEAQHARVVHLVDVIAGEHDQAPGTFAHDGVEVLVDGVGGALIPVLADAFLRRQDLDEFAELFRDDVPAHPDVAVERQRLVLGRDEDAAQAGVDAVAEREIDDAVGAAEVDRRLGALLRQRVETFTGAAREHDGDGVVEERGHMGGRAASRAPARIIAWATAGSRTG